VPAARRSRRRTAPVTAVAALMLTACGDAPVVPEFAADSWPDGTPIDVDELRGSPVLLAGWATWCVPCERELPMLDAFADTETSEGIEIVAVNVDRADVSDADLASMLDRLDVDLPVWRDVDQSFLASYEGAMMPYSVLLDRDGAVADTWTGSLDTDGDDFLAAIADVSG